MIIQIINVILLPHNYYWTCIKFFYLMAIVNYYNYF